MRRRCRKERSWVFYEQPGRDLLREGLEVGVERGFCDRRDNIEL